MYIGRIYGKKNTDIDFRSTIISEYILHRCQTLVLYHRMLYTGNTIRMSLSFSLTPQIFLIVAGLIRQSLCIAARYINSFHEPKLEFLFIQLLEDTWNSSPRLSLFSGSWRIWRKQTEPKQMFLYNDECLWELELCASKYPVLLHCVK